MFLRLKILGLWLNTSGWTEAWVALRSPFCDYETLPGQRTTDVKNLNNTSLILWTYIKLCTPRLPKLPLWGLLIGGRRLYILIILVLKFNQHLFLVLWYHLCLGTASEKPVKGWQAYVGFLLPLEGSFLSNISSHSHCSFSWRHTTISPYNY